ncbi:MAG: leucyl aminopeptidase [Gammaproteobacteria bacterium]|nr:leucyl aminopeptidase [Gammaproteobacteria bacterium]
MKTIVERTAFTAQLKTCLVIGVLQKGQLTPTAKAIDDLSQGALSTLLKTSGFDGRIGQTLPIYHLNNTQFDCILLVGCGKAPVSPTQFRKVINTAIKSLEIYQVKEAVSYLSEIPVKGQETFWKIKQSVEGAWDALYRFDQFKTEKEPAIKLEKLTLHIEDNKELKQCELAVEQGAAIAQGIILTKNLANLPSNICTPSYLLQQAHALAKEIPTLTINALDQEAMQVLNMGALLAVAKGSKEPPYMICIEYKGGKADAAPIVLVGKGVTFDSGGISLKTPDGLVGMKYDMSGAASVFGTLKAASLLKLPINIVGVIPAVENMPDGAAYKPEDILTSMSGLTIEVISTDAEGRLILGDALTYCQRYNPEVVIDIATLTGAVIIALGFQTTGLIANDDDLAKDLLEAGLESNDRAWQLPMWDEYQEQLKSPFADMANVGGRSAGTITAGCFLSRFAKKYRWAHLDIAGTAGMGNGVYDRMSTGRPVPLLMQYLIAQSQDKSA